MTSPDSTRLVAFFAACLATFGRVGVVIALAVASTASHAAQTLHIRDGDTTVVRISVQDQTRVRVAAGRVTEVIGDVYDAERNPGGRVLVLRDEAAGEVYLRPTPAPTPTPSSTPTLELRSGGPRPIKLDIKTDRGTVALLLQPTDIVGETLTLQLSGQLRAETTAPAGAHLRSLKALTLALVNPELAPELSGLLVPVRREIQLWAEARFVLTGRLETPTLLGEVYELSNVSDQTLVIDERELFTAGVKSVAVERLQLAPGQTTRVWVVRDLPRER